MRHKLLSPSRWQLERADWGVLVGCSLLHAALALSTQLSVDEAHYALYGALLDWSYFDHPPLVGWLQWPFVKLGGSDFAMRSIAMITWVLSALGLMRLTQALFPLPRVVRVLGVRADLLLYALALLPHLLGLAWVPDTALTFLACGLTLSTWQLIQTPVWPFRQVIQWGLWLGVAGLTKYTAVLLAVGVLLAIVIQRGLHFHSIKRLTVSAGVALVCIAPVIYWNAQHQWISFDYQLHHASGGEAWHGLDALRFGLVVWLAMGLLGPWALYAGLMTHRRHQGAQFLGWITLPSLLMWMWASGHDNALPHWSVPALTLLIPLAAQGLGVLAQHFQRLTRGVLALQALIVIVFLSLMAWGDWRIRLSEEVSSNASNPFADLYGWQEAAIQAQMLAKQHQVNQLAVMNWTLASRLAWYARPMPVVVLDQRVDQFDLWFGALAPEQNAMVVDWSSMPQALPTREHQFQTCQWLSRTPALHWGRELSHFDFYLCTGWQTPKGARP